MRDQREQERLREKSRRDIARALRTSSNVPSPGDIADEELDAKRLAAEAARQQERVESDVSPHVRPGELAAEVDEQSLPPGMVDFDPEVDELQDEEVDITKKKESDIHMAEEPAGGTPVGGLAGTNIGNGAMINADAAEAYYEDEPREPEGMPPYAGPTGGAVGGTPAEKRVPGGDAGGIGAEEIPVQESDRGDSTIGSNPPRGSRRS